MIESPVRDSWNSSPPPGPSAKGKRCHSRREMATSDKWEMDYSLSYFVSALVEGRPEWQAEECLSPLKSVFYTDRQIRRLRERYEFRENATVEDYLEKNPSLRGLLARAHNKIREYFGSDVHAVLEMVKGFEADDDERLFVFIQTELSSDEALDRLDELYDRWWLGTLSGVQPKLNIDVEYV